MKIKRDSKGGGCWYFRSGLVCTVCGDMYCESRERRWTKKPKKYVDRNDFKTGYCRCMDSDFYG